MRRIVWIAVGATGGILAYRRAQQALADARERGVVLSAQQVGASAATTLASVRALAASAAAVPREASAAASRTPGRAAARALRTNEQGEQ